MALFVSTLITVNLISTLKNMCMPSLELMILCNCLHEKVFVKIGPENGYCQVKAKESDKVKTAFQVSSLGFNGCNIMPFGLCSGPATFQRLMERCVGDQILRDCLIYLDDIIIFSATIDEHLER